MRPIWQPYLSFWRRYRITILAVVAIAALSVGGLYARSQPFDAEAFRAINSGRVSPAFDILGIVGYALGTYWFSVALFGALYFLGYRPFAISSLGAITLSALIVLYIKYLAQQPRPAALLTGVRLVGPLATGLSFPSGHASQAFVTAFLLASYFSPPWSAQLGLYGLAGLIALARVYVGAHLPVDIMTGALIGLSAGFLWVHSRLWPGARRGEQGRP